MHKRHLIAAIAAIIFTGGIWVADIIYDSQVKIPADQCRDNQVQSVSTEGLFNVEVTCVDAQPL